MFFKNIILNAFGSQVIKTLLINGPYINSHKISKKSIWKASDLTLKTGFRIVSRSSRKFKMISTGSIMKNKAKRNYKRFGEI